MSDGLRQRAKQRRLEPTDRVELGASAANAFFTSKRIRQRVSRKPKPPPLKERLAQKQNKQGPPQPTEEKEENDALQLPSRGQLLAELRVADGHVQQQDGRFELQFSEWKSELLAGYNLLFYGVGSKLKLLQEFASTYLSDGVVMQVHGYLPVVSLKYLAGAIQEKVGGESSGVLRTGLTLIGAQILHTDVKPNQSLSQQCRDIAKMKLSRHAPPVYLLVHSIDGVALRNAEAQTCLSWLAKAPFIALVASMDHINGPSIWREEDSLRFEWLCQNLDTCQPYTDEIELRLAKRAKTADATSNGVKFILQSLTPTDVATLQELARQQLVAAASSKSRGRKPKDTKLAPYQSVYEACRKKLLHTTPLAMKNSVKCLEDHGLLKKIRVHTVEYLEIPLPEAIIKTDILRLDDPE
ncbi:Origin recognition complex subunit [Phytophthora megakarya]|uniref:Origin recognition complex subunit 2 n=1 Tax=Phytophthora megakarya TaxID=4795 RepID=A0A225WQ31_9STRA|nr:Origin recognition complex subunit [Phytophthora megakarya]